MFTPELASPNHQLGRHNDNSVGDDQAPNLKNEQNSGNQFTFSPLPGAEASGSSEHAKDQK